MCEEYESFHDRAGEPVLGGQSSSSFVPSVIKTNVPLKNDDPAQKDFFCKDTENELKSYHNKTDWANFVWVQDSFECCWNRTVFHDERYWIIFTPHRFSGLSWVHFAKKWKIIWPERLDSSERQHWARIGSFNLLPTRWIWSVNQNWVCNKDYPHSWVRNSHRLNKLVTNLNNNEQETSEMQFEEYALKLNASDFACRSKAKAKPQKRDSVSSSTRTIPIGERKWTDVAPGKYSISAYEVSKKLIRLLRHGSLPRNDDGAIEFWRIKDNLRTYFLYCHHRFDDKWKSSMAGLGGKANISVLYWFIRNNSIPPSSSRSFQYAFLLILHYRTMPLFRRVSSSTFIMSDVRSICFPSSIQDWYREVKIWATGIRMPDFEVLDAKIASALNRIIHNSHFKSRVSLEEEKAQKENHFVRRSQIAYLIYEYFRVTGANDSVKNYADLFSVALRNDDIQEFDSIWDGILLSMTKIPSDDILAGLYKSRIRESEKLKTVLELYDLEIHQKQKFWGKKRKLWKKRRLQILSCNRMKRKRRKPEVPEDEVPVEECFDGHARIISKELAPIHHVKNAPSRMCKDNTSKDTFSR